MAEYIVTRCNSMADNGGIGSHPRVTMGTIEADNHKQAMNIAHGKFTCSAYQWLELDNAKYTKPARVHAARRIANGVA